jgi:hypothetical protein
MRTHFFHFDSRFCGATESPRRVSTDAAAVDCPVCRRMACAYHESNARHLGHVADYCPDCEQPYSPDVDDPSVASMTNEWRTA